MSTYNTRQRKQVLHSSKEHLNFLEYKQTNITNRTEEKKERIPTGRRLNSWLFTKRGGVEIGTTEDKSIQ